MNPLIKYSLSHLYRIIKVYALLALLGALAVVIVQLSTGLKWEHKDQEALAVYILSEVIFMLFNIVLVIGTSRLLVEEIKSVLVSWRRVQAQFDKEIGHLAEEIISAEIGPRVKS